MSVVDTAALRATAEAATPGPWETDEGRVKDDTAYVLATAPDPNDAAHIAAFDPPTVLALLDELDTLRATVARIQALADHGDRVASQFPIHGGGHLPGIVGAHDLRAALVSSTPDPTRGDNQ